MKTISGYEREGDGFRRTSLFIAEQIDGIELDGGEGEEFGDEILLCH